MKAKRKRKSVPSKQVGPKMNGSDCLIAALEREGVEVVFAYPGGASMEIHQSLTRSKKIRTILPRQEQGGGFMAHGYARATGKAGVCVATSGPGATNLVTCIADAFMDSVPLVAITGQVYQEFIGKSAFQETDFFGMTLPIVKHSYLVLEPEDLPWIIREAFYLAQTGRPGPVVIDIPKDIQQAVFEPTFESDPIQIDGYKLDQPKATDDELKEVLKLIEKAKNPVLYTGGGIISGEADEELKRFAEITGMPVTHTLMGLGVFDPDHAQSCYWYGMHGTVAGNWAVCESDLLLCAGARFDDRITGKVDKFAPEAYVIHFDVDKSEHNKNVFANFPIQTDIKYALARLCELAEETNFKKPDLSKWLAKINQWKEEHPFSYEKGEHISSQEAIEVLYEESKGEAILTTGVGQHQMWAAQYYRFKEPRSYISSLGLGTMGFGYPAALGAKVARPDKEVVDIDGDGSFIMNIQELATAKMEKINAKCLLLNNQHLGMVMQWEDRFYESVRGHTILCDPENLGGPDNLDGVYPNFTKVAESFGIKSRQISKREDLSDGIREMLDADEPFLLEVIVPYTEHVLPMIAQGKSAKEILTK